MKNKLTFLNNIKMALKNGAWVLLTALGIKSLTYKIPYLVVLGVMLILVGFIFFPWLDKLGIKLSSGNKWFVAVCNIFISAYLISPEEESYYKCILPIVLMILVWLITIFYANRKNKI